MDGAGSGSAQSAAPSSAMPFLPHLGGFGLLTPQLSQQHQQQLAQQLQQMQALQAAVAASQAQSVGQQQSVAAPLPQQVHMAQLQLSSSLAAPIPASSVAAAPVAEVATAPVVAGSLPPPPGVMTHAQRVQTAAAAAQENNFQPCLAWPPHNPMIKVPFFDESTYKGVNLDLMPSEQITGFDLPLSDVSSLRFFYNIGVMRTREILLEQVNLQKEPAPPVVTVTAPTPAAPAPVAAPTPLQPQQTIQVPTAAQTADLSVLGGLGGAGLTQHMMRLQQQAHMLAALRQQQQQQPAATAAAATAANQQMQMDDRIRKLSAASMGGGGQQQSDLVQAAIAAQQQQLLKTHQVPQPQPPHMAQNQQLVAFLQQQQQLQQLQQQRMAQQQVQQRVSAVSEQQNRMQAAQNGHIELLMGALNAANVANESAHRTTMQDIQHMRNQLQQQQNAAMALQSHLRPTHEVLKPVAVSSAAAANAIGIAGPTESSPRLVPVDPAHRESGVDRSLRMVQQSIHNHNALAELRQQQQQLVRPQSATTHTQQHAVQPSASSTSTPAPGATAANGDEPGSLFDVSEKHFTEAFHNPIGIRRQNGSNSDGTNSPSSSEKKEEDDGQPMGGALGPRLMMTYLNECMGKVKTSLHSQGVGVHVDATGRPIDFSSRPVDPIFQAARQKLEECKEYREGTNSPAKVDAALLASPIAIKRPEGGCATESPASAAAAPARDSPSRDNSETSDDSPYEKRLRIATEDE